MKPPEVQKYLFDIAEASGLIEEFVAGKSFEGYTQDRMLRSAVERQFEIIGEALVGLLRVAPELAARVTDVRRIIAFRNRLIHGYASVADEVVWGVIETNLTALKREVRELIDEP